MEMNNLGRHDRDDIGSDENSDDDETLLGRENYGGESQRAAQEVKSWNLFREPIVENESGSMESQVCMEVSMKIVKVFFYIMTFCIVLGAGVISKGTLLFMTSQLRKDRPTTYCNAQIGKGKQFISVLPELERIAWIWCIFFAYMVPELGAFIRSMRICFFKSSKMPSFAHFILVCTTESLHTIGLAILAFVILPEMDVVKGAMITNCMCIVPGIMSLLSRNPHKPKERLKIGLDILAILAQISGFIVWPLVDKNNNLWFIGLASVLISIGWWENFLAADSPIGEKLKIQELKKHLMDSRYATYMFVSLWKIAVFLVAMVAILWIQGDNVDNIFSLFSESFASHPITIEEITPVLSGTVLPDLSEVTLTGDSIDNMSWGDTPMYVLFVQIGAAWLCYVFGKFTCRILIQGFSFALPVNLTIPVAVCVLIAMCGLRNGDPCYYSDTIPPYLFFESPPVYFLNDFVTHQMTWVWILWLVSQTWIMFHIWTPKCERLAPTEKLFVLPMYDSLLIDQSLGLNRTSDDQSDCDTVDLGNIHLPQPRTSDELNMGDVRPSDHITRIYACATMWHESKEEMLEFLKSIFRIDEDQSARRIAQTYLQVVDPDYYEYETHIFLDDGFDKVEGTEDYMVNEYVKDLVHLMDKAASAVHLAHIRIRPPKKYPTPYGGRLEWSLPGKTKFVCHLKNKDKIRHRKRWSQVMYMYYLLGYRLMDLNISVERKEVMAENTYLLTLDGDIDFQPGAVRLLVDLMKRNRNLGAACGRIHPIGSGPMVWYQMFEYAIGHWLQKATEHVIGCVLCSPGCFSLFRAKALMDDNVMKKYTTKSDQARHYVQYDQGEDRWLCTLILQRGYRVEYSAASDAYTHCPEGFNEFYIQRRRWVPSTMANIFDLLFDFKKVVKINDNISMPYISYLIMLMGGTILGPGTIFLMLVGAFVAAFKIDNWTSFLYNIIPILIFMVICYTCKTDTQLLFAGFISAGYGLVMMAVLVGLGLQIMEDGWLAPSSLFLFVIIGEMFIAALLHPQELYCLPAIIVYYITIPSMYLLLIIFSLFNMNDVTWGTRGSETKDPEEVAEEEKKAAEAKKGKTNFGFFQGGASNETRGSFEFSFAGLFKCMFCTHPEGGEEKARLALISDSMNQINKKLETLEKAIDAPAVVSNRRRSTIGGQAVFNSSLGSLNEDNENDQGDNESVSTTPSVMPKEDRDDLSNPAWIEDPELGKGETDFLPENEINFWTDLLALYLYPIDGNKAEKDRITKELLELRDRSVFGFFMLNALFVLIVFLLQLNKDVLHIEWPFGTKTNITYDDTPQEVFLSIEYLELEPIGLVFVIFFALILVVQFTAMLFHRFGTLSHILASTELDWYCSKKAADLSPEALVNQNGLTLTRRWQKISDENDDDKVEGGPGGRKTIRIMTDAKKKSKYPRTLDAAFIENMMNTEKTVGGVLGQRISMRRDTLSALQERRETVIQDQNRRISRRLTANADRLANNNNMGIPARSMRNSMRNSIIPPNNDGGQSNRGFEAEHFDDDDNAPFRPRPRPSTVTFRM